MILTCTTWRYGSHEGMEDERPQQDQWTDATWNPCAGAPRVSEGCRNCYAERMAARFSGPGMWADGLAENTPAGPRWTGRVELVPDKLDQPLYAGRPCDAFS